MVSLEEFRYSVEREFVVDTTIRADLAAIELLPIFAKQWCKKPEFGFLNSALQKRVRTNPVSMFFLITHDSQLLRRAADSFVTVR